MKAWAVLVLIATSDLAAGFGLKWIQNAKRALAKGRGGSKALAKGRGGSKATDGIPARTIKASTASVEVEFHISQIMAVFANHQYNEVWNENLSEQTILNSPQFGQIVLHKYHIPWPAASREFLMKCGRDVNKDNVVAWCHSVTDPGIPQSPGMVRAVIEKSVWTFTPVKGQDKTVVSLEAAVDPGNLPTWVVNAAQKSAAQTTIDNMLGAVRKLKLPPHRDFVHMGKKSRQDHGSILDTLGTEAGPHAETTFLQYGLQLLATLAILLKVESLRRRSGRSATCSPLPPLLPTKCAVSFSTPPDCCTSQQMANALPRVTSLVGLLELSATTSLQKSASLVSLLDFSSANHRCVDLCTVPPPQSPGVPACKSLPNLCSLSHYEP